MIDLSGHHIADALCIVGSLLVFSECSLYTNAPSGEAHTSSHLGRLSKTFSASYKLTFRLLTNDALTSLYCASSAFERISHLFRTIVKASTTSNIFISFKGEVERLGSSIDW